MSDIVVVAHKLAQTLEKLGVVYWIGGSMASAIHGGASLDPGCGFRGGVEGRAG